jgi:seryl-tRNA synthetase
MRAVGGLEYKYYEIDCAIRRLKRKLELIQAKKNRQEKIVLSDIEKNLDSEFADYEEKLNKRIADMNAALRRGQGRPLSDEETREIKKLYYAIVKLLHPDLHPDLGEAKTQLFHNAVNAYKNGDLNGIRAISAMVAEPILVGTAPRMAQYITEKEHLSKLIQEFNDRIIEIKTKFPYTMKMFVQNPKKINERRAELEESIKWSNEMLAEYAAKIDEMLREEYGRAD